MFELFCLVNNFMIWERKNKKQHKKQKKEKKRKLLMVVAGFDPGTYWLRNSRLTTELPKPTTTTYVTMYLYSIWRLGPYDLRPAQSHNSNFGLKKNLTKCIMKVVNVSKSQYYEFRHNIMNLGNKNSKYSWWIRDLENPKPEHNSQTPS